MKSKVKLLRAPNKALRELERINKSMKGPNQVLVGLPKDSGDYPDGTSVIMVGAVHEFGSPLRGVPQRSFLRTTITDNRRAYKDLFRKIAKKISAGDLDMKGGLGIVGLQVQADVREKITDIKEPPLKHREGNPLVDTGHLRQSITFEVKE